MVATDRRTSGAQVDDEVIELKAAAALREAFGDRGHVNVTSYNRMVLLTGEVPNEADKAAVEQVVARIDNVRSVVNELRDRAAELAQRALQRHAASRPRSRPASSTPRTCSPTRSRS